MSESKIIQRYGTPGSRETVTFLADGKEYQATVRSGTECTELHRVQRVPTPEKWTSVSKRNPRFAKVTTVLFSLLQSAASDQGRA